jgi:hypothetical protein
VFSLPPHRVVLAAAIATAFAGFGIWPGSGALSAATPPAATTPAPSPSAGPGAPSCANAAATPTVVDPDTVARHTSFHAGEDLFYSASFSHFIHIGWGEMHLVGADTVRGMHAWKATLALHGGPPLLRVNELYSSWFDSSTFTSLRFAQLLSEPRYHADKDYQIFPDQRVYRTRDNRERPSVANPMDDVSLVYFVRTLPLVPGQCYELHRYYEPNANPVVVQVVRRERITVPAGTFDAVVLHPEIKTAGIFAKGGNAELWFSDDSARVLLQLKTKLSFGSISLYLTRIATAAASAPPS